MGELAKEIVRPICIVCSTRDNLMVHRQTVMCYPCKDRISSILSDPRATVDRFSRKFYLWVMVKVIKQSIKDAIWGGKTTHDTFYWRSNARFWLFEDDSSEYLLSFLGICRALDLDPEMIRGFVRELMSKDMKKVATNSRLSQKAIRELIADRIIKESVKHR